MASFYTLSAARAAAITAGRKRISAPAPPRWYYMVAAFLILHALEASGIVDRLVYGDWTGKPGDKITQSLNLLLILASLALFARGGRGTRAVGPGANIALGLAGFLLCSVLWSVDRGETIRQILIYLPVVVGSIGIASNFDADEYMHLLAQMCFSAAIGCLILFAVSPASTGVPGDSFRGIFAQKNVLGEAMQIGALASLHGLRAGNGRRLHSAAYLVGAIALALMSASATSCLIIFVYCAATAAIVLIRRGDLARFLAIVGILVALPAVIYIAAFPDSFLAAIGKNPTLTGRTLIWAAVIPDIWRRPVLGWGFMAFWSTNNPAAVATMPSVGIFAGEAHNGILELLLEVGLVGTAFFLFLLARNVWMAMRCLRTAEKELAVTSLLCCLGIVMLGVSEEVLVVALAASTSVFFITGFMCEKAVREAERSSAPKRRRTGNAGASSTGWLPGGANRVTQPATVLARPAPWDKGYKGRAL